jgi:hypothetical protein
MKVLDLQCNHQHSFEGWFASQDDFEDQLARDLIACPVCADTRITKKLSAPRLNLSTSRGDRDASKTESAATTAAPSGEGQVDAQPSTGDAALPTLASPQDVANLEPAQLQAALMHMVRQVVAHTEDVGNSFPEEARKMHYGEATPRNIRGQATPEETEALIDEGIAVLPLPMPEAFKGPLQ